MKLFRIAVVFLAAGILAVSCDSGSDNSGGTTGGSGDATQTASSSAATTSNSTTSSASSSSTIWLDAFSDFNCTSNWTNRDGALGLAAYSGSGSCTATFPGESGTYRVVLTAQTEYDGKSPYQVSINGQTVKSGEYPLSSPLGCDCPHDNWRDVCPDRNQNISIGTFSINQGSQIGFWGDDVYPCGDEHGSYTKWHGMTFTRVN